MCSCALNFQYADSHRRHEERFQLISSAPFELRYSNVDAYTAAVRSALAPLPRRITSQALLMVDKQRHVFAGVEPLLIWQSHVDARGLQGIVPLDSPIDLAVMDAFLSPRTIDEAFDEFSRTPLASSSVALSPEEEDLAKDFVLHGVIAATTASPLTWKTQLALMEFDTLKLVGTSPSSCAVVSKPFRGSLLRLLIAVFPCVFPSALSIDRTLSREDFGKLVEHVGAKLGVLAPLVGMVTPTDLYARINPLCNLFGFTRGTPFGRYYLERFLANVRPRLFGRVLEVGGSCLSQAEMSLYAPRVEEYVTCDLLPYGQPTVIGDASNADLFEPASFDVILSFNVLEHCRQPWNVIKNFARWLRPGGEVAVQVPNAQVLHRTPVDCFRILPDGMRAMFEDAGLGAVAMHLYGNLHTSTASLHGLAVEDVDPTLLDIADERFPVITCCIAKA